MRARCAPRGVEPRDVAGRDSMHGLGGVPTAMPRRSEALVKDRPTLSVDDGQGEHLVAARVEPCGLRVEDEQLPGPGVRFWVEL